MNNAAESHSNLPTEISAAHTIINQNICVINELTLKNHKLSDTNQTLLDKNQELQQQNEWFHTQYFGEKSEKIIHDSDRGPLEQLWLGLNTTQGSTCAAPDTSVKEHVRKKGPKQVLEDDCGESGLRFDSTVEVEESTVLPVEAQGLSPEQYVIIETKVTERLCQRSGSYYVKRTLRPVVKIGASGEVKNAPAPDAVFERSYADVTLLAGIVVDKFQFHLPLYRQHQRLTQAGITLARTSLTNWVLRTALLLEPIYKAVLLSVLRSKVLAMDETPLKAGLAEKGKLHRGYIWALYGDKHEAAFLYSPTRAMSAVEELMRKFCGVLVTDGYTVYEKLCATYPEIEHALCWAHTRREFFEALEYEPERCKKALDLIAKLYAVEAQIRDETLHDEKKQRYRLEHARGSVDALFIWLKEEVAAGVLLPSNKFQKAANYALAREHGLRVYLSNAAVPIDTNHLEREIRPFPLGRKNWLFCWTEVGADAVAILQTLIANCKLHQINPFEYLVDVLQKINTHKISKIDELTPRLWALHHNQKIVTDAAL